MEVFKRKILLENSIDRTNYSKNWGSLTADTFFINVFLTQNVDDMGLFTDIEYFSADTANPAPVDYTILINKLSQSGITFPFMANSPVYPTSGLTKTDELTLRLPSKQESDYYNYQFSYITGSTDSKIDELKSYDGENIYQPGFNINAESYINYIGSLIDGVSRITQYGVISKYVFDAENDLAIGTDSQNSGFLFTDYSGVNRTVVVNGQNTLIPRTDFRYIGEGRNETNTSLSAITKEEYLFGIISKPEVKNDVFIDRGATSVMDYHLRLSEIKNLEGLTKYDNGFYNIVKQ
jgi:hypothetical protein